ncbi:MAG: T9SS type A sorting domain-containing protein [Bacteroidota bacterium]|nr:MAG: T9SS type A sorting domain-containing protein [Bacteroidota bacterium]
MGVYKSGNSNEGTSPMSKFEIESGYLKTIQLRSRDERETNNQELTIYPNPTSSILYFKVHSGKMVELEVFDIAGKQLIHEVMQTAQQTQM